MEGGEICDVAMSDLGAFAESIKAFAAAMTGTLRKAGDTHG